MDLYPVYLFLGFGLIFGITGTLIVYGAGHLAADRRAAGAVVFFFGCAASVYYASQMPPQPFAPVPLLTSAAGFLMHPLFFAAGVLIISGYGRYRSCPKAQTIFPAVFLSGGISAVFGGMGLYTDIAMATGGLYTITPSLLTGITGACIAVVCFTGICEAYMLLQKREAHPSPER